MMGYDVLPTYNMSLEKTPLPAEVVITLTAALHLVVEHHIVC